MTHSPDHHDLLTDEALGWLDPDDARALERLRREGCLGSADDPSYRNLVDAAFLTVGESDAAMPPTLRAKLLADAARLTRPSSSHASDPPRAENALRFPGRRRPRVRTLLIGGAAAAAAFVLWMGADLVAPAPSAPAPPGFTLLAERTAFAESTRDAQRVHLMTENDRRAVGEVLWSNGQRRGFCTLRNLAANDRLEERYELFLVDAVTGMIASAGVFDVTEHLCDTIIPFELPPEVRVAGTFMIARLPTHALGVYDAAYLVASASIVRS